MKISTCQGPEPKPLLPRAGSPCVVSVSDGNPIFLVRQDKTFLHPQVLPSSHTPHLTCRHMLLALPQGTCSPACYHAVQASIASPLVTALAPAGLPPVPSALLPTRWPGRPFPSVGQFASLFCSQPPRLPVTAAASKVLPTGPAVPPPHLWPRLYVPSASPRWPPCHPGARPASHRLGA